MAGTNPIATWLRSVFTTQTPSAYKAAIDGNFAVAERIVGSFAPQQQTSPNMTIALRAGNLFDGTTLTEVATQNTGTITAPVSNPRIDRVVIDAVTGAVSVITGTPAGSPTAPAITAGKIPVAQILLQTTSTTITNSMITDERALAVGFAEAAATAKLATSLTGGTVNAVGGISRNGTTLVSDTAPVIASGFGTSPSISNSNGSFAFRVNVGTGGTANSGVVTMPPAPTGWMAWVAAQNSPGSLTQTLAAPTSNTSITLLSYDFTSGANTAWVSNTILHVLAVPY